MGTTVTEYAPVAPGMAPAVRAAQWRDGLAQRFVLCVIKDLPQVSPLLDSRENFLADQLVLACRLAGFIVMAG